MPPKPKFTREDIINGTYDLMKTRGIDAVVAREVGKHLGSTTAPIFTCFNSMDELKDEVRKKAKRECADYLNECMNYFPAFKEFGLRWIRFAKEYPHVYELLFLRKENGKEEAFFNTDFIESIEPLKEEIVRTFNLTMEEAGQLIQDSCIYAQGIASMIMTENAVFHEEELGRMISRLCISQVAAMNLKNNCLDPEKIRNMFSRIDKNPEKIR